MASTLSPYGFRAVNELGGLPYAGSTRSFPINPAGYAVNIFNGSLVYVAASGYLQIVTTTGADSNTAGFPTGAGTSTNSGAIGVFVGCTYTNAQGQIIYSQYYPANTASVNGSTITAYVVDDDRAVFQVQAAALLLLLLWAQTCTWLLFKAPAQVLQLLVTPLLTCLLRHKLPLRLSALLVL